MITMLYQKADVFLRVTNDLSSTVTDDSVCVSSGNVAENVDRVSHLFCSFKCFAVSRLPLRRARVGYR